MEVVVADMTPIPHSIQASLSSTQTIATLPVSLSLIVTVIFKVATFADISCLAQVRPVSPSRVCLGQLVEVKTSLVTNVQDQATGGRRRRHSDKDEEVADEDDGARQPRFGKRRRNRATKENTYKEKRSTRTSKSKTSKAQGQRGLSPLKSGLGGEFLQEQAPIDRVRRTQDWLSIVANVAGVNASVLHEAPGGDGFRIS